jgi:hypothetical protein
MLFLNNFFPVRVYYSKEYDRHRLEAPRADIDTIEFKEDFLPSSYELVSTLYVINPRVYPPLPLGMSMFTVYQREDPPFHTHYIEWVAFPIMTNNDSSIGNFSFFAFTTAIPNTIPVYIRNKNKDKAQIFLEYELISNYFATTVYSNRVLDRENFLIYVHRSPELYWKATTECLCIPSSNSKDFPTLLECENKTYPNVKNVKSYTGNSAIPLSWIRDQIYPQKTSNGSLLLSIVLVFLSALILIVVIFLRWYQAE